MIWKTSNFYIGSDKTLAYFQSLTLVEIYKSWVLFVQASYTRVVFSLASPSFYRWVVFPSLSKLTLTTTGSKYRRWKYFDLSKTLTLTFSTGRRLWSSVCETSLSSQKENVFYIKLKRRFSYDLKLRWVTFWYFLQSRRMKEGSF